MPQTLAEFDAARRAAAEHAAPAEVPESGYHPGPDDSPTYAKFRGFLSGAATGLPMAAKIVQGVLPIVTGGASIPAQMAIGAGTQMASDLADASTGDPDAPQSFGEYLTRAGMGAAIPGALSGVGRLAKNAGPIVKAVTKPGPVAGAIGAGVGYHHGGVPGAIEGGVLGYTGGSVAGRLGRILSALEGGGAASAVTPAVSHAVESEAAPAAAAMRRSTATGPYETEQLYNQAQKSGFSDAAARKAAGMPTSSSRVYNAEKGSAFPPNVKIGDPSGSDASERVSQGVQGLGGDRFDTLKTKVMNSLEGLLGRTPAAPAPSAAPTVRQVPEDVIDILRQRGPGTGPNAIPPKAPWGHGVGPDAPRVSPTDAATRISELEQTLQDLMRQRNFIPRGQ